MCEYIDKSKKSRLKKMNNSHNNNSIAHIDYTLWQNYSHGQILIGGEAQSKFIDSIFNNETKTMNIL